MGTAVMMHTSPALSPPSRSSSPMTAWMPLTLTRSLTVCLLFPVSNEYFTHLFYLARTIIILLSFLPNRTTTPPSVVQSLQNPDGSFSGDEWGEVDLRFCYCAISCMSLLKRLDAIDVDATIGFVVRCKNYDGGFGSQPGSESHAAMGRYLADGKGGKYGDSLLI